MKKFWKGHTLIICLCLGHGEVRVAVPAMPNVDVEFACNLQLLL